MIPSCVQQCLPHINTFIYFLESLWVYFSLPLLGTLHVSRIPLSSFSFQTPCKALVSLSSAIHRYQEKMCEGEPSSYLAQGEALWVEFEAKKRGENNQVLRMWHQLEEPEFSTSCVLCPNAVDNVLSECVLLTWVQPHKYHSALDPWEWQSFAQKLRVMAKPS